MKDSITKFADASIEGLSAVVGGKGKCKTTKSKSKKSRSNKCKKSGSKKSKSTGSRGGKSCPPPPCW